MSFALRRELRRHALHLAAALALGLLGLALPAGEAQAWHHCVLDGGVVTLLAALLPQDRLRLPLPLRVRLAGPGLAVALYLFSSSLVAWSHGAALLPQLGAVLTWLAWSGLVAAWAELGLRRWGPGLSSLTASLGPAALLLAAPVTFNPVYALWAFSPRIVLVLCPLVAAARAQSLEVVHQPLLYELSALDSLEFHYPPWYLHAVVALALATLLLRRARRTLEDTP